MSLLAERLSELLDVENQAGRSKKAEIDETKATAATHWQ
jgi:hypothetical protein